MPPQPACFLHVPKSGGSSVISSLRSTLGAARLFHANESRYQHGPLDVLLALHPDRYQVVAGHFSFAQITDTLLDRAFFFTFLREPVDRVLSHYYYYRSLETPAPYGDRVAQAQELDLEPFVEGLPARLSPWSNWQTFVFSGATHSEQPAEELLPAALRNLERMHFVGIHDEVDEGFRRLCEIRHWPAPPPLSRENVTPRRLGREQVPPGVRQRLAELNACDRQLFARARELWNITKTGQDAAMALKSTSVARPSADPVPGSGVQVPGSGFRNEHGRNEHGTREITLTRIHFRTEPTRDEGIVHEGDRVFVELRGHSQITEDDVTVGIRLTDDLGLEVYGVNTRLLGTTVTARAGEDFELTFAFEMRLSPGIYRLTTAIHAGEDHLRKSYHWIDNALSFECRRAEAPRYSGLVDLQAQVSGGAITSSVL
jgi:hypothetical protein